MFGVYQDLNPKHRMWDPTHQPLDFHCVGHKYTSIVVLNNWSQNSIMFFIFVFSISPFRSTRLSMVQFLDKV